MKKEVKSQAALEFLTTYAWAFLVILIAIAALYYFGIFDFSKFLPQKCLFPSQFECLDFVFVGDPTNEVRFKLVNSIGEKIMVTALDITNDATPALTCATTTPPDTIDCEGNSKTLPFEWDAGLNCDYTLTNCQDGAFITDERTEAKITITYYAVNTPSQPLHDIKGKITAVVISP